ncbi:hypothetical protein TeGR_g647 [Tetraparma gracilis]|uniref:Granulins domain-containing protein n=1 Tax=Tetraparma gracilis TaxID=2962635 RepID=A0ABQ6N4X8_9STRA|nr:hypothetical protein TeGR_g647 [Tetraparma gracilis]
MPPPPPYLLPLLLPLCTASSAWTSCPVPDPDQFDDWSMPKCPDTQTCSPNGFSGASGYGCCPFKDAVSCPSGYQCCPSGSRCSLISGDSYSAVYDCLDEGDQTLISQSKCPCKPGAPLPPSDTLYNVFVIGDSLSIGFTPLVAETLSDIALVQHIPWDTTDGGAEEAAYFEQCLDNWLRSPSGLPYFPDLIYFNSGMHNLNDNATMGVPGQSGSSDEYAAQMERITDRLVDFAASSQNKTSLMYGLTTPWLCDAGIDATITGVLNAAAAPIMAARGIPVVDTHSPITDQCGAAPVSSCFDLDECYCPHCAGHYDFLANDVIAPAVRQALEAKPRVGGAKTNVKVLNEHKNDITYKLTASSVGGCGGANQPLAPGAEDSSGCYCSWGTLNNKFVAYDPTHPTNTPLCETADLGSCYAHTEKGLDAKYLCTVTYEGMTDGQAQAACSCSIE